MRWNKHFHCTHWAHRLRNNGDPQLISLELWRKKSCGNHKGKPCKYLISLEPQAVKTAPQKKIKTKKKKVKHCWLCGKENGLKAFPAIPFGLKPMNNKMIPLCKGCHQKILRYTANEYGIDVGSKLGQLRYENEELRNKYQMLLAKVDGLLRG